MQSDDPKSAAAPVVPRQPGRRQILAGLVGAGTALAAGPALAGYWKKHERRIGLRNLWTDEELELAYWREGTYDTDAMATIDVLLRDRRTGQIGSIFYQVLDHLVRLAEATGAPADFDVISGFRSGSTNAWLANKSEGVATNSLHTYGMAIDIRHPDISVERLFEAAAGLNLGGAGLYRRSNFVHIDVGPARHWTG